MSEFIRDGYVTRVEAFGGCPAFVCYRKEGNDFVLKTDVMRYFRITESRLISLTRTHRLLDEQESYITADSFFNLRDIYMKYITQDRRCGQSQFPSLKYIKKERKK